MSSDRWAKREGAPATPARPFEVQVADVRRDMYRTGYVDTPGGRYFVRCCHVIEAGVCRRRLNHKGECDPRWEG